MRRVLALAALAGLAFSILAASAAAQAAQRPGVPIVGSGSFGSAPVLESGKRYADSVRPGEILFYAVDLQAGQTATANVHTGDNRTATTMVFFDPLRRRLNDTSEGVVLEATSQTPTVGPKSEAELLGEDGYGPGRWFLAVHAYTTIQKTDRYEVPFTVQIDVAGATTAAPTPTPRAASPTPGPESDPEPQDDAPPLALLGGVAGAGLLLGGLGGTRMKRR